MKMVVLLFLVSVAVYSADSEKAIDTETWCRAILNITAPPIHYATTFVEKTSNEIFVPMPPNYANYTKPYCTNLALQPESIFDAITNKELGSKK